MQGSTTGRFLAAIEATRWDAYSPVVSWPVVRTMLTLATLNKWTIRRLDFQRVCTTIWPPFPPVRVLWRDFRVVKYKHATIQDNQLETATKKAMRQQLVTTVLVVYDLLL
jgi:hypothetical protein